MTRAVNEMADTKEVFDAVFASGPNDGVAVFVRGGSYQALREGRARIEMQAGEMVLVETVQ